MIHVLVNEINFVKCGAEGVLDFGVRPLQEKDVLVLLGEFLRVIYKGLLVGLLRRERVLLDEVQLVAGLFSHYRAVCYLPHHAEIHRIVGLRTAVLTHLI